MSHRPRQMLAAVFALVLTVTLTTPVLATPEPAMPAKQEPAHAVVNPSDPAAAQLKVTEKVAIEKALQTFAIPNDLGKPNVNLWTDSGKYGQGPTWNLSWERDPRLGGTRISYSVGINAQSGEIVSYSVYQSDPNGQQPKIKYTRDEAQKFADEWYAKLIPIDKTTESQNNPQYANSDLNYTWVRVENGVPFPDNVISININPSDGSLSNFYRNWDENLTFPAVQGVVSAETAQAAYTKAGSPELIYQRFYTPAGRSQVKLVYVSKAQNANVDALTGQLVDYNGEAWIGDGSPIDLGKSDAKLVKLEKQMTREEALALARQYLGEDAKAEPTYTSYHAPGQPADKYGDESIRYSAWAFNWDIQGKEANQNRYLSATVDIDHGVLMNFNSYDGYVADEQLRAKTPVAEQAARATAIEFVKRVRPDLINELLITDRAVTEKYRDWPADRPTPIQREYYFNFRRMVNGLRFDSDNLSVSVDRFSGQVRNFYLNWTEPEFPKLESVKLTPEQALAALCLEAPMKLTYTRGYVPYSEGKPQFRLVYRPTNIYNGSMIDSVSGHLFDYSGRDVTELKRGAEDIADHPAKHQIQIMINRGVFEVKDGKFGPDLTMTRGEVAKALVIAFNQGYMVPEFNRMATLGKGGGAPAPSYADVDYDNGYFGYVEAAVRAGILLPKTAGEELNPDEIVTHEELTLLTCRAMGYAKVINMKTKIMSGYTDAAKISADCSNAVGLLAGLEVLDNQGEFKPQEKVTRAYVAKMLVPAIQQSQGRYYY